MGGGGIVYQPIDPINLEAWGRISGNEPTQWELSILRRMNLAFIAEKSAQDNKKSGSGRLHQDLGEYCHGAEIENCRKTFGAQLEKVCSTCPN